MSNIKVVSKKTHDTLQNFDGSEVKLSEDSVVVVGVNHNDVVQIKQEGLDALITLKNGEVIKVVNFFNSDNYETLNSLVFEGDDSKLVWVQFKDAQGSLLENITYNYINDIEPLLYQDGSDALWGWFAVPLTAAGIIAWAGHDSKSSDGGRQVAKVDKPFVDPANGKDPITGIAKPGTTVEVKFPDGTTGSAVVNPDGKWSVKNPGLEDGDKITVVVKDPNGNTSEEVIEIIDAIAPKAPVVDPVNGVDPITGTAEPDSKVTVTFPNGEEKEVTVGPDGKWTVPNPGLKDGDEVKATATDKAGNESPETVVIVDAVAPNAPVIDPVNGVDPITGTAEPDSKVTVTFPNGEEKEVTVGPDGKWTVPNPGLKDGDEVKATTTDKAGNKSPETVVIVDAVAPNAPEIDPVNGVDPITGTAEPDSKVTVTFPNGEEKEVTVGPDGKWTVPNPGLKDGDEVKATTTDKAGNKSPETVVIVDAVAPNAPEIDPVNGVDPITGTAEPDSKVTVTFPNGEEKEVTVGPDGKWTVPNPGLKDGDEVKATATDKAGNESPETVVTVVEGLPGVPYWIDITGVYDDVAPVEGKVENNGHTNDTAPLISGSVSVNLSAGEKIIIYRDGVKVGEATVDGKNWTFQDSGLADGGKYVYTASVANVTGGIEDTSSSYTIQVDTTAPSQIITITEIVDNKEPSLGVIENGASTNDDTPEIKGELSAGLAEGEVVVVYRDGVEVGVAVVSGTKWTFADTNLDNYASYTYTAKVKDLAGNTSAESNDYTIITNFDGVSQFAIIETVLDDSKAEISYIKNKGFTADKTPTLKGSVGDSLNVGDEIIIKRDGVEIGKATITDGTSWTFTDNLKLDGSYNYTAVIRNGAGVEGPLSSEYQINLDTVAPDSLQIDSIWDDVEFSVGELQSGDTTNDRTPTIKGSGAEANATIILKDTNGNVIGTAVADATGHWSVEPSTSSALKDGLHTLQVVQQDQAGNESSPVTVDLNVDTAAPTQSTVITGVADDVGPQLGNVSHNGFTDDTSPTIQGSVSTALAANEFIVIMRDGVEVGRVNANDINGTSWSFTDNGLVDGKQYQYTARVEDTAGNRGGDSNAYVINIDTTAPTQTVTIDSVTDNVGPIQEDLSSGAITDDSEPQLNGSLSAALAANEVVVIYRDGVKVATIKLPAGSTQWTYTDAGLKNGESYTYTAQVEDASGLTGPISNEFDLTLETNGSTNTGVITGVEDDVDPITGNVENNGFTNDTTPLIHGEVANPLSAGEKVIIYRDGVRLAEVEVNGTTWSYQDTGLEHGQSYSYTIVVESAAGLAGATSHSYVIHVDTEAPTQTVLITDIVDNKDPVTGSIANGGFTNDDTPELKGTLSHALAEGETVVVYRNGEKVGTATVTGTTWTFEDSSLASGSTYEYTAQVQDAAGNTSDLSNDYSISTNFEGASQTTSILRVVDDASGNIQYVENHGSTGDTSPTLEGSLASALKAGDQVIIMRDGVEVGSATVNGTSWTFTDHLLGEGSYNYTAKVVNNVGVEGAPSNEFTIHVDTTAPTLEITASDLELSAGEEIVLTFTFSEAVKGFDASDIVVTGGVLGGLTQVDDHTWTATFTQQGTEAPSISVADGSYTDLAGNDGLGAILDAANGGLEVDTDAPAAPVIDPVNETDPITGTAEPGSTVTVTFPNGDKEDVVAGPDGSWTVNNPGLKDGDEVKATATDKAGNESPETVAIVDGQVPTLEITASDLELSAGEEIVLTFTFSEAVKGFDAGDIVVTGGVLGGLTQVDDHTWTATFTQQGTEAPSISVADGSYTDLAGNDGLGAILDAANGGLEVDTDAPAAPVIDPVNETDPITGTAEPGSTVTVTFPNGDKEDVVAGPDGSWTVNNPGLKDGDEVKATATDKAGNESPETVAIVDGQAPTLEITASDLELSVGEEVVLTFTFSEAVKGFDANDIVVTGGVLSGLTQVDDHTWTATFTQQGTEAPSISVADGSYTDLAGNNGLGAILDAANGGLEVDTDAPAAPAIDPVNETDPITGTAEPGSTVTVTFPNGDKEEVVASPDGSWTVNNPGLKDGDEVKATATDKAGNVSPETVAIVDGLVPTLEITASDLGLSAGEEVVLTFTFSEAVKGFDASDIVVTGGVLGGLTQVDDHTWTATFTQQGTEAPSISVADGSYTDLAGNDGLGAILDADNGGLEVDTDAPAAPAIDPVNETDPITGTAEPGSTVTVTFPNGDKEEVVAGPDGSWTVNNPGLKDGDEVKATATDKAGNVSPETVAIVDGQAPTLEIIAEDLILSAGEEIILNFSFSEAVKGFDLNDIVVTGGKLSGFTQINDQIWSVIFTQEGTNQPSISVADGSYTDLAGNDGLGAILDATNGGLELDTDAPNAPVIDPVNETDPITGTAEPGSIVTVTFPNGDKEDVVAGPDGSWTVPNPGLTDGDEVKAIATDKAGNESPETVAIVDGQAPTLEIIAEDLILSAGEEIILNFSFSEAVKGFDLNDIVVTGGKLSGFTQINDQIWSVIFTQEGTDQPSISVADGSYTDLAGNDGLGAILDATNGGLELDTDAPNAPVIDPVNPTDPITGTAEPGSTVTVTFPNGDKEEVVAGPDGSWTVNNPGLKDGDEVKATATDKAGNESPETVAIVDGQAPTLEILAEDLILSAGEEIVLNFNFSEAVKGFDVGDIVVTGGVLSGFTQINDQIWTAIFIQQGTEAPSISVADGSYTDLAGNDGLGAILDADNGGLEVDTDAPAAPAIDPVNETDPITGTAEPGSTVTVTFPNGDKEEVVAGPDGSWTVNNPGLKDGDEVKATATDKAGNESPETVAIVDGLVPTLEITASDLGLSAGEEVVLTFTFSEAVKGFDASDIVVTGGVLGGLTQVDDHTWTATFTQQGTEAPSISVADGSYTDLAGNNGLGATLDPTNVAPDKVIIESVYDDVAYIVGEISEGGYTNDTTPTLTGSGALAGAIITLKNIDGDEIGTAVADDAGNWRVEPNEFNNLSNGSHTLQVTQKDSAGFESEPATFDLIVDTIAPMGGAEITHAYDDVDPVIGRVDNEGFTNDTSPRIEGVIRSGLAANEKVAILRDGVFIGFAESDGVTWSFQDSGLTHGIQYMYTARLEDAAGNRGGISSTFTITIDTLAPTQKATITQILDDKEPVTGDIGNGGTTDDRKPVIQGRLDEALKTGETVAVYRNGEYIGDANVVGLGWEFNENISIPTPATYVYTAQVVDRAGNHSTMSDEYTIHTDFTPVPAPTGIITINSFEGADTTPTITGAYSTDLAAGEYIQVLLNGKTYKQGDSHLTVNTATKTWSLNVPVSDALNLDSTTDSVYDVVAQKVNSSGQAIKDTSLNELTVYRDVSINLGVEPDYTAQKPLLSGNAKFNSDEGFTVEIYNSTGQVVATFSSTKAQNQQYGMVIDSATNSWRITAENWGALELPAGKYNAKAYVTPKDGQGGQSETSSDFTVVAPKIIGVPNNSNSDINAKVVGLSDGGYMLVWAQNQGNNSVASGLSRYDVMMQRYDQLGGRVGELTNLTNTDSTSYYGRVSEGYADRGDMWNNNGSLSAVVNANGSLTVAYTSFLSQWGFIDNYSENGVKISSTQLQSGQPFYFGYNFVETSKGNVAVFTSGTIWNYNLFVSGTNASNTTSYGTAQQLTHEAHGGNGYIYNQNGYLPTGAKLSTEGSASNTESVSAISLGGSKYLIQYAEFNTVGHVAGLTKETLVVYDYNGTTSTQLTTTTANQYDNGWQIGAKSLALKEGGFVSLWLSNHSSSNSATDKGTMDGFDVYSRRFEFNESNNSIIALDGLEKRVNTTTSGVNGAGFDSLTTGGFSGAALAHGGYVVVWVKMNSKSASEVYSQAFDAAGNKIGGETLVSAARVDGSGSVNLLPNVTALKDGGYVVTWSNVNTSDYAVNDSSSDIKMVIVNADGTLRAEGQTPPTSAEYFTGTGTLSTVDNAVTTLDGRQGATDMIGGSSSDYFIVKDTNFNSLKGGDGTDTLIWDSTVNLNLADLLTKVQDIEVIHLGDKHANTLTVSLDDVLSLSSTSDTLVIQGGDTDKVSIDMSQWMNTGTQTYHGLDYKVYSNSEDLNALLLIQNNLSVIG